MSSSPPTGHRPGPASVIALYALARLGLLGLITAALLVAGVPVLIAVLVGLIVTLPLSMVLFRGLRGRLDAVLAELTERRSAERAALRARRRGDEPPVSDEPAQRQPDAGGD